MNRGVRRLRLFDHDGDYRAFLTILSLAQRRLPMRCLAYCLMPNHFHLVLWPYADGDLSRFMFWLLTTHSKRWHLWRGTNGTGAVYQGRFKSIPVASDEHFLRLCRYVERNPARARLVDRAELWPWSSLSQRLGRRLPVELDPWPVDYPKAWLELVNRDSPTDTEEVRQAVRRGRPFGPEDWTKRIAIQLGLESSLRGVGRPKEKSPGVIS